MVIKKSPKWDKTPRDGKNVKISVNPESTEKLSPAWQFHKRDMQHEKWGWANLTADEVCELIQDKLCAFESMTWAEIFRAIGDRSSGNLHHNVSVQKCCKEAQERLAELRFDDVDEIFSLRLTNKHRLFGIKEGRVLRFIWNDPDHSVYPVSR